MERLTIPDKKIDGGVRRAFIDVKAVKENAKPSPFVIRCNKCGGAARDISGIMKLAGGGYYPLPKGASYFANKNDADCGVPVLQ